MHSQLIQTLTKNFESSAQITPEGIEFWLARDLQELLEYSEWRNFTQVIEKAKIAAETSGNKASDHFVNVNKMVKLGSGSEREVEDIMLTRYACYLIAQNGDPRKEAIAFAQNYFAIKTRERELDEKLIEDKRRILLRKEMSDHNSRLAAAAKEASVDIIHHQSHQNSQIANQVEYSYC